MPDEAFLHCPAVEAPRVTELTEGFVVLEYTVLPNGSVDGIRVLESGGDPRWVNAATATLSQWKFKKEELPTRRTARFNFEFED